MSTTTFGNDNRNRLTTEVRVGQHPYDLAYEYDIAGNRTQKLDALNDIVVNYVYDVSDPEQYGSQGNRLMSSIATRISSGGLVEERWYAYEVMGNVEQVIRRIAGDEDPSGNQWYRGTRLYYAKNGRLWLSRSQRWQLDAGEPVSCEPLAAMEYRYDAARARYMLRPRDPVTMVPQAADDGDWFDHDGNWIYGDFAVSYDEQTETVNATDLMAHEPGLAQSDHATAALEHVHGNLIGTTEAMTDGQAVLSHRAVYTAFGEPVWSDGTVGTRYGYAGAWGYQAPETAGDPLAELRWLHVGERYYDPSCGRFVQRDPIGIRGGLNVYVYARNNPLGSVDPNGLQSVFGPPSPTGPPDRGMFDMFWTKVHYSCGFAAGLADFTFWKTTWLAIKWEFWEPKNWPDFLGRFNESYRNQVGDVIAVQIGWTDAQQLRPVIRDTLINYWKIRRAQRALRRLWN